MRTDQLLVEADQAWHLDNLINTVVQQWERHPLSCCHATRLIACSKHGEDVEVCRQQPTTGNSLQQLCWLMTMSWALEALGLIIYYM